MVCARSVCARYVLVLCKSRVRASMRDETRVSASIRVHKGAKRQMGAPGWIEEWMEMDGHQ